MVGYTIGRTMSETDGIPEEWVKRCNLMDEVWVPTDFHVKVFADSGVDREKLIVVPEPVDTDLFSPDSAKELKHLSSIKGFKFLAVAKWEERKNFQTLVKVFTQEFNANDDVALIVLTHEFHHEGYCFTFFKLSYLLTTHFTHFTLIHLIIQYTYIHRKPIQKVIDEIADNAKPKEDQPKIFVVQDFIPDNEMPNLYKSVDCLVVPSKGEGWGRPHCEAMSTG